MPITDYQTALVTGASSGIGAATVHSLTGRGLRVYALARRADRLAALADETGCETITLDLRDYDDLHAQLDGLDVDIVVGNAGTGRGIMGLFDATPEDINTTIDTNVTAMLHVLRAVVPGMIKRKRGHVVNIGSVAGLHPLDSAIYGSSKGAVHRMSTNLRRELRGSRVRVTEICPGRVATEFYDASVDDPDLRDKAKTTGVEELTSADVANAIMFAIDAPWRMNISTIELAPTEQTYGGMDLTPV